MRTIDKINNSVFVYVGFTPDTTKNVWGAESIVCTSDDAFNWQTVAKLPELGNLRDHSTTRYGDYYYIVGTTGFYRTKDFDNFETLDHPFNQNDNVFDCVWAPDFFQDANGNYHIVLTAKLKGSSMTYGKRRMYVFDVDLETGEFTRNWQLANINCEADIDASIQFFNGNYYCFMSHNTIYVAENYLGPYTRTYTNIPYSYSDTQGYEEGPEVVLTNGRPLLFTDQLHSDPKSYWDQSIVVRQSADGGMTNWSYAKPVSCDFGRTIMRHGSFLFKGKAPEQVDYFPDVIVKNSSLGTKVRYG
ncbi:hypothetical protein M8332_06910 (plasmid) [Fructilactobacillus ixorae]|uniref:Glycosyl hydrolase family 43 n=1 Tax=Fructilactobacillus ixorae TaxID=1750535 RepID=A0ABY5C5G4_9LACO|nr:hypothetical protein [Fructilactobacillus ixorae]USS94011.1 hypothetical protein M8332_06910 [Fructilactobacillus ixorae]